MNTKQNKIILDLEPMKVKEIKFQKSKIKVVPYITPEMALIISSTTCRNYYNSDKYNEVDQIEDKHYYTPLLEVTYFMLVMAHCTNIDINTNINYDLLVASGIVEVLRQEIINYDSTLELIKFTIAQKNIENLFGEIIEVMPNLESINETLNTGQDTIEKLKKDGKLDEVINMMVEKIAKEKLPSTAKKEVKENKEAETKPKTTRAKKVVEEPVKKTTTKTTTKKTTKK